MLALLATPFTLAGSAHARRFVESGMNPAYESRLMHGPVPLSAIVLAGGADLDARVVLLSALTFAGYRVRLANTGSDLLREALGDGVGLVLSDIHLCAADGVPAIRALKSVYDLRDIPVLAYSSSSAPDVAVFARSMGADAFLKDPADLVALFNTVASMLAVRRSQRALARS